MSLIFNITCQIGTDFSKECVKFVCYVYFIHYNRFSYFGSVFFVISLQKISFIVFHVFLISDLNMLKHVSK